MQNFKKMHACCEAAAAGEKLGVKMAHFEHIF